MSKTIQQVHQLINQQAPLISNIVTLNRGLAYHVDPNLTGKYRNFVRLEAEAKFLLPDQTYILDRAAAIGDAGLLLKGVSKIEKGETLEFKGDQYLVVNWDRGIAYIDPPLVKHAEEKAQFRSISKDLGVCQIISKDSLKLKTNVAIFSGDVIQIGNALITRVVSCEQESDNKIVQLETDISSSLNLNDRVNCDLICAPHYISDLIKIDVGCPYFLVFPIASYFSESYTAQITVDRCDSKGKVLFSETKSCESGNNLRFSMFNSVVKGSCIAMMRRVTGKLDFNGSALGLHDEAMIEWCEDFPTDSMDFIILSGKADTKGTLIVRYDPLGIVETLPVVKGLNTLKVRSFGSLKGKCSRLRLGFKADKATESKCFWLSEIIPNQVYSYIRYTIRIESSKLFRREHFACYGPKVQPSLPDMQLIFDSSRLDSGFCFS